MDKKTPVEQSLQIFHRYAGMGAPELPVDELGSFNVSALQVKLARWQNHNFGFQPAERQMLGVMEEVGELSHAILKNQQGIRGMDDQAAFKDAAGDAIADTVVYLIQLCTSLRLDFGTLLRETARDVMERNWVDNPEDAHEVAAGE